MEEDSKLNILKKKKTDAFSAENVNNTAPVKHIVDEMELTNHQAFMYLNSNRRPRTQETFFINKHYLLPGHQLAAFPDDWDGDLSPDYFQPFKYKSTNPKMTGTMANIQKQDPLSELLQVKEKWRTDLKNQRLSCLNSKIPHLEKYKEHAKEVVSCPKIIVDMAKQLENDPDAYFNSSYNWYYAGHGNMQLISINHQEYLMCSEFHLCYIFEFNRVELTYSRDSPIVFDCGEGTNICESIWSSLDNIIALRTKHKIFILKIVTRDNDTKIQQIKVAESKMPYTSISFDQHHKNILYVTELNNILKIVNLDRLTARTVELKNSVKSLVDNWNTVIGNERAYYTHIASNAVTLYDKRTNKSVHRWKNIHKLSDDPWCNLIGAAKYSTDRPHLYVATNHHLFAMDMRYQTNQTLKPLQRWTHGMQCFPTYISICNFEFDKELVCLASQWCEDTCVVPNHMQMECGQPEFKGITIPYRLPSILQTLKDARLQALCIDEYNLIENRLVAALTGNLLLEHGDKYAVLSHNSLGDVTAHLLYPEALEMFIEDDSLEALHEWCQDYDTEKEDLVMTCVRDVKDLWKKLQDVPEGEIDKKYENEETSYDENEVIELFKSGQLDEGLLDVWLDKDGEEASADNQTEMDLSLNITQDIDNED